jgi:uncharacterized protein (TIGR00255 family)
MATYSMTGYGRAEKIIGTRKYTIELRSLNSKQIDLSMKIPSLIREIEMDMRSLLVKDLERGKVECMINYENLGEEKNARINTDLIQAYAKDIEPLRNKIKGIDESDWLNALIKLPEVLVNQRTKLSGDEKKELLNLTKEAIDKLNDFRITEGKALQADLLFNTDEIQGKCNEVEEMAPQRIALVRERLEKSMDELREKTALNTDRFEQELIFYIEKLDINEELIRLNAHIKYFKETIEKDGAKGKKLGFITQEMGREINTIGSKANHSEMQRNVILMKDNLERIKEQVLNVL